MGSGKPVFTGNPYPKSAALARAFALNANPAAKTLGHGLADAKPHTRALYKLVELDKTIEDDVLLVFRNAHARVFAADIETMVAIAVAETDIAFLGKLDGIGHKVGDDLVDATYVERSDKRGVRILLDEGHTIANALLEQATPVLMTNFSKILNQMGAMYTEERYQYIASFNHYSLLIIDDLGIERSTEYAKEQVYAVIDERYKANLPLIITTNLTINEIRNPENVADARIYIRVLEMCTPVHVGGGDRRQAVSRSKQELVKDVLFSGKGGETS